MESIKNSLSGLLQLVGPESGRSVVRTPAESHQKLKKHKTMLFIEYIPHAVLRMTWCEPTLVVANL